MKKKIFIIVFTIIVNTANALTIKSVSHGAWSNPSTWSSGVVPSNPDSILIKHYVTFAADLTINAPTVLLLENTGTLCGDYLLNISCGSRWYNYGSVFINRFIVRYGANYCTLTTKGTNTVTGCPTGQWSVVPPKGNMNIVVWTACNATDTNWELPSGITGGCTVGIKEYFTSTAFSFYPNPVSDKLKIEHFSETDYSLNVKDIFGRQLITENRLIGKKNEIDLSSLSNGVYFLEIIDGNNILTKRITKN